MATVALPAGTPTRGRLRAILGAAGAALATAARNALKPHKAALGNVASMPLTVVGGGCINYAAFHVGHGWGWLITGLTLVVFEHIIADDPK